MHTSLSICAVILAYEWESKFFVLLLNGLSCFSDVASRCCIWLSIIFQSFSQIVALHDFMEAVHISLVDVGHVLSASIPCISVQSLKYSSNRSHHRHSRSGWTGSGTGIQDCHNGLLHLRGIIVEVVGQSFVLVTSRRFQQCRHASC